MARLHGLNIQHDDATDLALMRAIASAPPPETITADPKHVFILSGGIGAGKTKVVNRLKHDFHFVSGSPADVMKEALAKHIAEQYNKPDFWGGFYGEMLDQKTKAEYRLLLQGFGEFFSNRDQYYWANQCVAVADAAYTTMAAAGIPSGIVFDSIRRPEEILAVKMRWPEARHIHLVIDRVRQRVYLEDIIGYTTEKAIATLDHSSEHWLDNMDGTEYDANYMIDANGTDEQTWQQLLSVIILLMDKTTLQVAASIVDSEVTNAED